MDKIEVWTITDLFNEPEHALVAVRRTEAEAEARVEELMRASGVHPTLREDFFSVEKWEM